MAHNDNKSCDFDGKVVYGFDRAAFIRKPNIFINGQAGRNIVDHVTGFRETVYFTRTANQQLVFCDWDCVIGWARLQEDLFRNRKKAYLRERAEHESLDRLEFGRGGG